eukprot:366547-Chlamydomonas_euryale.AAC.1
MHWVHGPMHCIHRSEGEDSMYGGPGCTPEPRVAIACCLPCPPTGLIDMTHKINAKIKNTKPFVGNIWDQVWRCGRVADTRWPASRTSAFCAHGWTPQQSPRPDALSCHAATPCPCSPPVLTPCAQPLRSTPALNPCAQPLRSAPALNPCAQHTHTARAPWSAPRAPWSAPRAPWSAPRSRAPRGTHGCPAGAYP